MFISGLVRLSTLASLLASACLASAQSQASLEIFSPVDGTVVNPGQTIAVSVSSPSGDSFSQVGVLGEDPLNVDGIATSLPAQFSLTIPSTLALRSYALTALGVPATGDSVESAPIILDVERPDMPLSLSPQFTTVTMEAQGESSTMMLLATFGDGNILDVTESSNISYQSSNPSIAIVNQFGTTTAVSPGSASIVITYKNPTGGPNLQRSVPVTVLPPSVTVSMSSLTFGADLGLRVGGSATLQLTLQNTTTANLSLTITSISAGGDYAETNDCVSSQPLPVTGTCIVNVTFTPTAQGERKAALTIVNNSSSAATVIPLDGFASANFDFSVGPSSQSVSSGSTANYAVTLSTFTGFSGNVSLAASGLPQGVTSTFTPGTLVNNGDVSTLVLAVPAGTPSGDYSFVITGTDGNLSVIQNAQLSVSAAVQDFTMTATPTTQQVVIGGTASYTVTVGAVNGFTGTVTPSVTGLPAGTTASFSPATLTGAGTITLTVVTSGTTPVADASLTITGTSGSDVHSTPVTLSVVDFGVSVMPGSQTVTAGSNTTYTVTATALNGFSGTVTPSVTGLPAGATATFTPATITGAGSAIMTVTTTSATLGANSTLTITGTSGSDVHSVTAILSVATAPSTGSITVGQLGQFLECPPADDFPWTMEITVNNVTDSWTLDCATTPESASALSAAWAAQINGDVLGTVVTATASGNVITLTSIAKGGNANYPLAAVDDYTAEGWFPLTASGPTMTGGH